MEEKCKDKKIMVDTRWPVRCGEQQTEANNDEFLIPAQVVKQIK